MNSNKSDLIKDKTDFTSRYHYETFRSVLRKNSMILQSMADLEADLNWGVQKPAFPAIFFAQFLGAGNRRKNIQGVTVINNFISENFRAFA